MTADDSVPGSSPTGAPAQLRSEGHFAEPESPFFRAWTVFILKYRWLCLLLILAPTAFAVWPVYDFIVVRKQMDMSTEAFSSSNSGIHADLEEARTTFNQGDGLFLVMVKGDVFTPQFLKKLKTLQEEIEALTTADVAVKTLGERKADRDKKRGCFAPTGDKENSACRDEPAAAVAPSHSEDFGGFEDDEGESGEPEVADVPANKKAGCKLIDEAVSIVNARLTRGFQDEEGEWRTKVDKLADPIPDAKALVELKKQVLKNPTYVGQIVGKEGKRALIVVRTFFMSEQDSALVSDKITEIIDKYDAEGFETSMGGLPVLGAVLNGIMLRDLAVLFGIGMVCIFIVMAVLFRHPAGIIGPMLVVMFAILWSLAYQVMICKPLTMLTNVIPAFLVCVGIGDTIHIQSVYRDARRRGMSNHDAIVYAIATTGTPVLFTTLTTMAGLLSFRFASVPAIGDMGTAGAIGVFSALVMSLTLVPIILSFNKKGMAGTQVERKRDFVDGFLHFCASLSGSVAGLKAAVATRRRRLVLVAGVALLAAATVGVLQLRVWHDPLSWLPPETPIRQTFDELDDKVGGTMMVQVVVKGKKPGSLKEPHVLKAMENLEKHIRAYKDKRTGERIVGNSISVLDVFKEMHQALTGGDKRNYRIPETREQSAQFLLTFRQDRDAKKQLSRMLTANDQKALMTLRTRWMEANAYAPLAKYIDEGVQKYFKPDKVSGERPAEVMVTGPIYTLLSTVSSLLWDLVRSFGIAFTVITVFMVFMLKSVKLGLIAMVPNLLPIACIMGIMGFSGIPIDMANLLIGSIAIGVAVDDTIHFLHHFRVHHNEAGDVDAAIAYSMEHSGRAMVATTLILCIGFFVFLASTMYSLQRFGLLIGLTVIIALLIDLIFCPALLRTFYKGKKAEGSGVTVEAAPAG
jgi:predicted RND superfamily exporter protein